MFPLPGSTAALSAVLVVIGSFCLGGYLGYDFRRGQEAKRVAAAQAEEISSAREKAFADTHAAGERARKAVAAQARARRARIAGVADAHAKAQPAPVCGWDDVSVGLLYNAIDSANDSESAAGKLPVSLSVSSKAGQRQRSGDQGMDLRSN